MRKRKRDDLWKCLFYLRNIAVFKGLGLHLVCEKERNIEWDAELDAKSVLASFRNDFRVVLGAKIVQTATWIYSMVFMSFGLRQQGFRKFRESLALRLLTVF